MIRNDDYAEFVAVLAECRMKFPPPAGFNPAHVANDAQAFRRMARALERLAVAECNRGLTEREEKQRANLYLKVRGYARNYGASAKVGGDPRGFALRLGLPTGRYNTLGGAEEGWRVPT